MSFIVQAVRKLKEKTNWHTYKSPALYSSSTVVNSVVKMIMGMVVVRYVEPQDMGMWRSLNVILVYSFILLFGVLNGLSRDLPYSLGNKEKTKDVESIASTSLIVVYVTMVFSLLIGIVFMVCFSGRSMLFKLSLATVITITIFNFYNNYLIILFRSKSSFVNLARVQLVEALIIIISLPIVINFHYTGLLVRFLVTSFFALLLLHLIRPLKVRPKWNFKSYKALMKIGTPIFILDYIKNTSGTFDIIALLRFSDLTTVGYYAISGMVINGLSVLPKSLSQYVYPRMTYRYGETHDPSVIRKIAFKSIGISLLFLLPIAIGTALVLPYIVPTLFPKYINGLLAAQITSISLIFSAANVGITSLLSMKLLKLQTVYQLSTSACQVICPFLFVAVIKAPLTGVALGMLVSKFISFFMAIILIYIGTQGNKMPKQKV